MTRYAWWGYVKSVIRKYPQTVGKSEKDDTPLSGVALRESDAVRRAVSETEALPDGSQRVALVSMVFWERRDNLSGAARRLYISERTAVRWHTAFIKATARNLGLLD